MTAGQTHRDSPPVPLGELAHLHLLRGADLDALGGLLSAAGQRLLQAGETLIAPGEDHHRALYLIVSGRLRVHLDSPESEPLSQLHPGESVGELAVIDANPASAYVVADIPSRVLVLPEEIFWALVHASHAVARNLLFLLSQRLRRSNHALLEGMRLQQEYLRNVTTDDLTGLNNRRYLQDALKRQITRCAMSGRPLCFVLMDIDLFKRVNDTHGHLAGDRVLVAVASTVRDCLRPNDLAARIGGEEFALVLPETGLDGALVLAERVRAAVEALTVELPQGGAIRTSISLGIAEMQPFEAVDSLIGRADACLYTAKRGGRNRACS